MLEGKTILRQRHGVARSALFLVERLDSKLRPSGVGFWIAADDLDRATRSRKLSKKIRHLKVPHVAGGLHEKEDVLTAVSRWTAGEMTQINVEGLEGLERGHQGARLILNTQHQHRHVLAGRRARVTSENEEASRVIARSSFARQQDLRTNGEFGLRELVESLIGKPMFGIVNGDNAAISAITPDFAKHLLRIRQEDVAHT
jgi:hypothetical protein